MDFSKFPKIELHLHLDCSLSLQVVQRINPSISKLEYQNTFVGPVKCNDLTEYLQKAEKGFALMQTEEQLRWVTLDLLDQLYSDNVIYAEIRFAPFLHLNQGLKPNQVVRTVCNALKEGLKDKDLHAGLILCTLRHFSEEQSMTTVKLVEEFKNKGVVGFDIAADESGYPIDNHIKAFKYARKRKLNCTAHAGEARGADSVWETLDNFRPSRIGHGVRSAEDPELLKYLIKENIHLELCPTSNVQTNAVDVIENHPADKMYNLGVSISINSDSTTITNTTLSKEYAKMNEIFDWQKAHFLRCNLNSIEHSFTSHDVKSVLREKVLEGFKL